MRSEFKKTRGSIALISMIIISAFALILAVGMAENSISSGYQNVNHVVGNFSASYAEGCFEEAIHKIETTPNFSGYTLNFEDGSCVIAVTGTNPKTVDITLNFTDYVQHYRGTLTINQVGQATNATLSTWDKI